MDLSEIAAGIEVTTTQSTRGVETADRTATPLAERLAPFADALPCSAAAVATLLAAYRRGDPLPAAADAADVAPMTAKTTLYRLGEPIDAPSIDDVPALADWLAGRCSWDGAVRASGWAESDLALAAYVATHEPIEAAVAAVAEEPAVTDRDDGLAETRSRVTDLL